MSEINVFDWTCQALEEGTSLERLEARGTVRLTLKAAGLVAKDVSADQMITVLTRVLPAELEARGVVDGAALCDRLGRELATQNVSVTPRSDSPENVFARLGGS